MKRLAGSVLLLVACNRTPPEPVPSPPPRMEARSDAPSAAAPRGKCVIAMAATQASIPKSVEGKACPADPESDQKVPVEDVSFPEAPGAPKVAAELVSSAHDVERGLMYRRSMAEDHGMLFRLSERREQTFWMRNTCIPLDMLFVDDDGLVVGVVEGAEPLTESARSVSCPSLFVLEVNAGWVRRHGVAPGQKMTIPSAMR